MNSQQNASNEVFQQNTFELLLFETPYKFYYRRLIFMKRIFIKKCKVHLKDYYLFWQYRTFLKGTSKFLLHHLQIHQEDRFCMKFYSIPKDVYRGASFPISKPIAKSTSLFFGVLSFANTSTPKSGTTIMISENYVNFPLQSIHLLPLIFVYRLRVYLSPENLLYFL